MNYDLIRSKIKVIRLLCDAMEAECDYNDTFTAAKKKAIKEAEEADHGTLRHHYWWEFSPYQREPKGMAFFQRRLMLIREEALSVYRERDI